MPHTALFRRNLLGAAALSALMAIAPIAALARGNVAVSSPFEVTMSPAGNYLSALVAGAERDTLAAATYFREALRFDPRNNALAERAFIASVSNGDMPESFTLANRVLKADSKDGLAHLVLGVRALKAKQWNTARAQFKDSGGGQRDITALMLNAWALAGAGESRQAIDMLDKMKDDRFSAFRDYHAGLIADLAGNVPEATKRLKSAYDGEKTSLRVVDTWARFLARHGDREQALKVYQDFEKLLPHHPVVVAAMKDLAAGKTLEPIVTSASAGAGEVLYGLGAVGGEQNDSLPGMIYLRLALYLAPDNSLAIITLADMYERLKQHERAIDIYNMMPRQSALRVNSDIQTGLILEEMGRSDDALKHLQSLVADNPKDVEALTALANLQRSRKQWAEAADSYTKALNLIGTPSVGDWILLYSRGIAYERSKQWPLAEADFKKALELKPDQPSVLNYLGYSWVDKGMNLDEAFRMLRRAVDLSQNDGYIIDSLGWAYYKLGRYDDALREQERAIDLKPGDPVINDHLGDIYWKVGRKLEAHFQWNHARDMKPDPEDLDRILKKIANGLDDGPKPAAEQATPATPTMTDADGHKNGG